MSNSGIIYDYILSTGNFISGVSPYNLFLSNQQAPFSNDSYIVNEEYRTGKFASLISANSQTLVEESTILQESVNYNFYTINSGDYYFDYSGNSIIRNKLFLDKNLSLPVYSNVLYDIRNSNQPIIGTGNSFALIATGLLLDASSKNYTSFNNDLFYNGQKIYSGMHYTVSSNGLFPKYSFSNLQAEISTAYGKIFAMPKKEKIKEVTGLYPDIYEQPFVENQTNFYINGMEQDKNIYLELFAGVTMIKTGLSASIKLTNPNIFTFQL
jgi:hypothetical protein